MLPKVQLAYQHEEDQGHPQGGRHLKAPHQEGVYLQTRRSSEATAQRQKPGLLAHPCAMYRVSWTDHIVRFLRTAVSQTQIAEGTWPSLGTGIGATLKSPTAFRTNSTFGEAVYTLPLGVVWCTAG